MPSVQYHGPNGKLKYTVIPSIGEHDFQGSGSRRISRLILSICTPMSSKC